jgi:hypothetical protein
LPIAIGDSVGREIDRVDPQNQRFTSSGLDVRGTVDSHRRSREGRVPAFQREVPVPILLVWTEENAKGIERRGIRKVVTEVDDRGAILREIGLDAQDRVLYIAPAERGSRRYGLFDLQVIDVQHGLQNEFSQDLFDELWAKAAPAFGPRSNRTVT